MCGGGVDSSSVGRQASEQGKSPPSWVPAPTTRSHESTLGNTTRHEVRGLIFLSCFDSWSDSQTVDQQFECPPPPKSGPRVCFLADVYMTTRGRFGGFWTGFWTPKKQKVLRTKPGAEGLQSKRGGALYRAAPLHRNWCVPHRKHCILCRKRRPIRASDQKRKAISISCQKQKKRFGIDRSDLVAEAKVDPKPCPLNPDSYPFICKSENLNPKP